MRFRKLERWEHGNTRLLYETVFSEDDRQFVDYYYDWKVRDSQIFAAEDADGIHAMVHLNPFSVVCCGRKYRMHYIVAVATQPEYRHRGLMRRLLELAEREMEQAGEVFTFLMPASEKIYEPFGYRFFAWQRRGILSGKAGSDREECGNEDFFKCRPVKAQEYGRLAEFADRALGRQFQMYVSRDAAYYERLCAEQQCQGGDVMVITRTEEKKTADSEAASKRERIVGVFCTSLEKKEDSDTGANIELREIILDQDCFEKAQEALRNWIGPAKRCRVEGCQPELALDEAAEAPLFMGKVPGGGDAVIPSERCRIFLNEIV